MQISPTSETKFVILRGLKEGNRFFSDWRSNETPEKVVRLDDGTVAYTILGYARTVKEVQEFLFGPGIYGAPGDYS